MSRSSHLFIFAIAVLTALSYFLPRENEPAPETTSVLANQAAILYLQMKNRHLVFVEDSLLDIKMHLKYT